MAAPVHEKSEMQHDVDHWVNRVSHVAKDPSHITAPTGTASWSSSFFGCFNPIDTCLVTCCCPCITFGRTHHRLNKDGDLVGYSAVNASCLGWWAVSCFGLHCIPSLLQRGEIRERAQPNLSGNFVTDFLKVWLSIQFSEYHSLIVYLVMVLLVLRSHSTREGGPTSTGYGEEACHHGTARQASGYDLRPAIDGQTDASACSEEEYAVMVRRPRGNV